MLKDMPNHRPTHRTRNTNVSPPVNPVARSNHVIAIPPHGGPSLGPCRRGRYQEWGKAQDRLKGDSSLPLEPADRRGAVRQLKAVAVRKRFRELLLVGDQQDTAELRSQVLQLLDHHLPAFTVEAAKPFVN